MRDFTIVKMSNPQLIAGDARKYSKNQFIKLAVNKCKDEGLQALPSSHEIKYGRILNPANCGRDFNIEETSVRGNFPVHCVLYI